MKRSLLTGILAAMLALSFSAADAGHWGKGPSFKQARKDIVQGARAAVGAVSTIFAMSAQHSRKKEACDNSDGENQCTVEETNNPPKSRATIENQRDPIIPIGAGGNMNQLSPAEKNPGMDLPHPNEAGYPRTPNVVD